MADGTSVGVISLDLVIKNQIEGQLNKIKDNIQNAFSKPMEQASQAAGQAVEKAFESAPKAAEKAAEEVSGIWHETAEQEAERMKKLIQEAAQSADVKSSAASKQKPEVVEVQYDPQYDQANVMAQVDKIVNDITEKTKKTIESIFSDFEIPSAPIDRLNKQLELAEEKMGILQDRHKELEAQLSQTQSDDEAAKLTESLNRVENQLLSQQNTIDKTKAKISELENSGVRAAEQAAKEQEKAARQAAAAQEKAANEAAKIQERAAQQAAEAVQKQIEKARQSAVSSYAQTAKGFEAAADSVGLIKQKLELNGKAMQACEAEIKRLKAEFAYCDDSLESEKIEQKLNAAQSKMISLTETDRKLRKELNTAGESGKQAGNSIKSGQEQAQKAVKKTQGIFARLSKSIKSAAKSVFLMSGAYAVFRGIKSAVETATSSNTDFAKSLNEVKANLSVAFTPIMNTVMPYLNSLMSGLASVTKAVASFISGLFGTTYQKSLEATKAVKKTADEAKKAEDTYLADFDVVRVSPEESQKTDDSKEESGVDYDALDKQGNSWAQKLGDNIRKYLVSAFETVQKKASAVFSYLGAWAKKNFAPSFAGLWDNLKTEGTELSKILQGMFADISTLGEPLKKYFEGDFTIWLQMVFSTLGEIAVGLFDTFNKVFSDIWNLAVFPIVSNFLNVGLPLITQFSTQIWNTLGVLFDSIKEIFDTLWTEAVSPVLGFIAQLWCDVWQSVSDFWNEWGQPIFDGINTAITTTKDIFLNIWETILKPVFDKFMETLDMIWTEHLQPLIAEFLDFVGELVTGATDIYNQFIAPIVNWLVDVLGPIVVKVVNSIQKVVGGVIGNIIDAVKGVITVLKGIIQFITGVFTGNWKKAWKGIKNIFKGIWDTFSSIVKTPINLIIDLINGLTGAVESALNWIIDKINTLSFDVPDWVPGIGGETFGFDFDNVDIPEIPKLATGGLATAPTLAMVGDNRNAKADPEVISPLSKLQGMLDNGKLDEVCEILRLIYDYLKSIDFTFFGTVDGKLLFKFIQDMNSQYKHKTGVSAF